MRVSDPLSLTENGMIKAENVTASTNDWDARKLGHDEQHVKRARKSHEEALDEGLGLQMISVRLQKQCKRLAEAALTAAAKAHQIS